MSLWERYKNRILVGLMLAFVVISINACVQSSSNFHKNVDDYFQGRTFIEVVSATDHRAYFIVQNVDYEWFFGFNEVVLTGTLVVIIPNDSEFLGVSEGSTVINIGFPNGTGESWMYYNIELVDKDFSDISRRHRFNIVEIKACFELSKCD